MDNREYIEDIQNKETVQGMIGDLVKSLPNDSKVDQMFNLLRLINGFSTADHVDRFSESPLEKALGYSLIFTFIKKGYLFLSPSILYNLNNKNFSEEQRDLIMNLYNNYPIILIPQLIFENNQRIDFLISIPDSKKSINNQLGIEVDGFEYHKDKFTADRKKDRYMKKIISEVYRFSGQEIYHNFMDCIKEITDWIENKLNQYK